jgi:hypothetical protein
MQLATAGAPLSVLNTRIAKMRTHHALLPWRRLSLISTCATVVTLSWLQPAGPGNISPVDVFMAISILTTVFWAISERIVLRTAYVLPMAVFSFAGAIASIFSNFEGVGLLSVVQDFVILSWAITVITVCRNADGLRAVLRCWAYAGIGAAIIMVSASLLHLDALAGITAREGNRATLAMGDPNMAAGYFCMSLMIVWASRTPRHLVARWAGCIMLVTAVVFTGSNGFSIGTAAACLTAATFGLARRRGPVPAVAMLCTVLFVAGAAYTQINTNSIIRDAAGSVPLLRDYIGRSAQSAQGRDSLLHETLGLVSQGGLIGIGPMAVKPTLQAEQAQVAFEAHSDYTASIAERGVLGGVGLFLIIVTIAFHARRSQARLPDGLSAALVRPGALIGALVACAIAANIYELMHFRYIWTVFAIVAAVSIWGRQREQPVS